MNFKLHECREDRLRVLLEGNEESADFAAAVRHVEHCPDCQRRLGKLAGQAGLIDELKRRRVSENEQFFTGDTDPLENVDPKAAPDLFHPDLGFLLPGSHPEMLGRLGRYEVEKVIGCGGMGVVLKAHDMELNRPVAIKVLAPHLVTSGSARQRFAREGRAAAAILHENVVAIYNVDSESQTPYLVMQYVDGSSLQTRVDQRGRLHFKEILRIGMQAAAGLAAAHAQGLVHRDIKPSNILLEGDLDRVFLTDFGLARAADDVSLTRTGTVAGTPSFMSPEQTRGEALDARSDLFSLGASLYFAATGHQPFRAEGWVGVVHRVCHQRQRPACEVNPEIPIEVSWVIDRLLKKKRYRRFQTADAVRAAMATLLHRSQHAGRLLPRLSWRRVRSDQWRARIGSVLLGTVLLAGLGFLWAGHGFGHRHSQNEPSYVVPALRSPAPAASSERDPQSWDATSTAAWERARADVLRRLEQAESANTGRTLVTSGNEASGWDREASAIRLDIEALASEWRRDAETGAEPSSGPATEIP